MPRRRSPHGSVIAFEGSQDLVATQLRLLPNSPKILTIPSLDHFLDNQPSSTNDDLRSTILHIHAAAAKRADVAKLFLGDATSENRKLVFLNGGTATAVARCIAAIRRHYINTTVEEAEFIYHELVRNGVAGLEQARFRDQGLNASQSFVSRYSAESTTSIDEEEGPLDDPISRAMKAADALDRETESLQPSTELDLTTASRARSMSLPMRRVPDEFENAAPFYVFGAPEGSQTLLPEDAQRAIARDLALIDLCERSNSQEARSVALRTLQSLERSLGTSYIEPKSPSCIGEPYQPITPRLGEAFLLSPTTNFGSAPTSPAFVGQAQVYDVRHSHTQSGSGLVRVKSVDRIYAASIRNQDIALCRYSKDGALESNPEAQNAADPAEEDVAKNSERPILRSKYYSEIPRATFTKATRTTIKRGPPCPLILGAACRRPVTYNDQSTTMSVTYVNQGTETERNYVDRGVDAMEPHLLEFGPNGNPDLPSDAVFEVVLPMLENLVIHFRGEHSDTLLENILRGHHDGSYPVSLPPLVSENEEDVASSSSSTSTRDSRPGSSVDRHYSISNSTVPTSVFPQDTDDYDPFASHGDYLQHPEPIWEGGKASENEPRTAVQMTSISHQPRQGTPSLNSDAAERSFHDFDTTECRTAVGMQNSLRSILNIYFPPEEGGFDNYSFPLLPEMGGLWKPVFRDGDSTSTGSRNSKIDLILAVGAQKGVERSFVSTITGSLEKLGTKSNGITRSGRLDLRYLIASAMQTFTSQPLANQTKDNPFTNSLLLATLIIPFLELYMAAHTDTRFLLLEYPPEHLTTVLALQRLIGVDLLKVAGIIDAEAGEPKPFPGFKTQPPLRSRHSAGQSISCMSVTSTTSVSTTATLLVPGMRNTEAPSFSRANFLLTSSATESEIATLISTIWKLLVDISPFYIPDGAPKTYAARRVSTDPRIKRVSSDLAPRSTTPLIDSSAQYAPLASAAIMLGFARPDKGSDLTSSGLNTEKELPDTDSSSVERRAPTPPLKSVRGSITETIRSSKTLRTMASQKSKIRNIMLGRDLEVDAVPSRPETMASFFDLSDDEDGRFAADERKYIPLFGRSTVPRKGNSRKALKWLGLSVEQ